MNDPAPDKKGIDDMSDPAHNKTGSEIEDIPVTRLALILVAAGVFVALSGLGVWGLMMTAWRPTGGGPSFGAGALPTAAPAAVSYIEPQTLERRLNRRLTSYGWVDRKAGIVHIPVDQAMDRLVERSRSGGADPEPTP